MEVGDFLSSADVGNNAVETVSAEATRARLAEEVNRMQVQLQGEKFAELHLREDETQENILRRCDSAVLKHAALNALS